MIHRRRAGAPPSPARSSPAPPTPTRVYPTPIQIGSSPGRPEFVGSPAGFGTSSPGYAAYGNGIGHSQPRKGGGLDVESMVAFGRSAWSHVVAGVKDAGRIGKSVGLVAGDAELRNLVVKVTLINLLSLSLLAAFPFVLGPVFHSPKKTGHDALVADTVGFWYNALINYPLFAACFLTNAVWGPKVAKRAGGMLHPVHRLQSTPTASTPPTTILTTLTRLLLIADFTLVSRTLALLPILGRPLATGYICVINAYYAYEWQDRHCLLRYMPTSIIPSLCSLLREDVLLYSELATIRDLSDTRSIFASRQWPLDYRCSYISQHAAYMFGFGLPVTLLTSFGPPLINMAIFALLYPFLLIQALHSKVPSSASLLTPSPSPSAPSTPTEASIPLPSPSRLNVSVPIFFFARNAIVGIEWLGQALARERGTELERRKRPY